MAEIVPCEVCKTVDVKIFDDGGVLCEWQPYVMMCSKCLWTGHIVSGSTAHDVIATWNRLNKQDGKEGKG